MNRRDTGAALLAMAALGLPVPGMAQGPKSTQPRRMGYLGLRAESKTVPLAQRPLVTILKKLGWIVGENLTLERGYADLKEERLQALAEELVRKRVEIIMTDTSAATRAAARATQTIPIVFSYVDWPVESGLIDSLARPGRNLTGTVYWADVGMLTKRLQLLREIAPAAKRLSDLRYPYRAIRTASGGISDPGAMADAAAKRLGFEIRVHEIAKVADVETALREAATWRAEAIMTAGYYVGAARGRVIDFAMLHRLPSMFVDRANVAAGGLLSYSPSDAELDVLRERWVGYADRILRGAKPEDMPVVQPAKFELVINRRTATAIGLTVPQSLLLSADEVIE